MVLFCFDIAGKERFCHFRFFFVPICLSLALALSRQMTLLLLFIFFLSPIHANLPDAYYVCSLEVVDCYLSFFLTISTQRKIKPEIELIIC